MSRQEIAETDEYAVRPFERDDRDSFLELHARIFDPDSDYDSEWFAWKYEDNPYVDHVPVVVAERDGELVGARPFFALDVAVDGKRELALQPGDTMVHPDHRRQGLFTRMTESAIETYTDGEPGFFFNFPNDKSGPGYLKLGWETVDEQSTYYRIQSPDALGLQRSSVRERLTRAVAKPLLDGYNWVSDVRAGPVDRVTVRKHASIPSTALASLHAECSGNGIHVWRDEPFYDWRFDNPSWDYVAYTAEVGGEPVAGTVAGTAVGDGSVTTKVTDVTPTPREVPGDALTALLQRVVRDHGDADVLAAPSSIPRPIAASAGFRSDDRPPLTNVANATTHVVRSLGDGWVVDGLDLRDERNWRLTFSERDTS